MSRNLGRPKRAGEEFTRTHYEAEEGPATKKPRFDPRNPSALAPDALEDDDVLEADEIGKRGQQLKRNAVNLDGYDSDSDNENFDARADARHVKQTKSKQEEQEDMFADLEDEFADGDDNEADDKRRGEKKKAVHFLDNDQIEGQAQASKSGGHLRADLLIRPEKGKGRDDDYESSSDSEVDDETRAAVGEEVDEELGAGSKKQHAPKLDAFNMRSEQDEGKFDESGNFVRKAADPDAIHDVWMEGISKKDMKKAAEAAQKREEDRRQKDRQDDSKLTGDLLATLIQTLERGETCLEALARLGKGKEKKAKWQSRQKHRKKQGNGTANSTANGDNDTDMHEDDPVEAKVKAAIEALTDAADLLLGRGQPEIYDTERELLIRQYRRETDEDWKDPPASADGEGSGEAASNMWEYRWADARDGGDIHGPYDGSMMSQWHDAGYFGEGVEFRTVGQEGWGRLAEFV